MTNVVRCCRAVLLMAVLAGCSLPASPAPAPVSGTLVVTAVLTDTPSARQFAAMLPLTLQLKDVWGQAKSGRLPHTLTVEGSTPIHDPTVGEMYFWPQSEVVAIYYDDLGQSVPGPGLIRLGAVHGGLDLLAKAGKRVTVRIERVG